MVNNEMYLYHENKWYWGTSIDIVRKDGIGIVCVKLDDNYPNTAWICDLSVHIDYRQNGIGRELMEHAFDAARCNEMTFAQLYVNKEQYWLVQWYQRLGFVILSQDEHEYTMIKTLR